MEVKQLSGDSILLSENSIIKKPAITSVPINNAIASRWSTRAFNPDLKVTLKQIVSICEAARWAPSCAGDEPWRFIFWNRHTHPDEWFRAFSVLDEGNKKWIKNAPVLFAAFYDQKFRKNRLYNKWASFDLGAACQNIYIQTVDLGLMAHPVGGFNADKLKSEFLVPPDFEVLAMIAIGYQAAANTLDDNLKTRELLPRKREALKDLFFNAEWDGKFQL